MKQYLISKEKYNGEIVYVNYDKLRGYKFTPKNNFPYDGIKVNEMIIIKPSFVEKVIKRKKGVVGPNYRDYVGPNPLSELESQSLANFTTLQQFNLTISLHSQGEEIYWDDRKWKN